MTDANKFATQKLAAQGLSHDLNNVFQTLVGVAANLDHEPELAAAILRSVERGMGIVAGFEQRSSSSTAALEQIIANAAAFLEDFRMAAKASKVVVVSQVEPGIVLPGHWAWERVLINLFLNSLRAMPDGGTIFVQARHTESAANSAGNGAKHAAKDGAGACIEIVVADEGTGIAPEMLDRLFEPHASGAGSTGLGLSIVESIVHASQGHIAARNRISDERVCGAEFIITVPHAASRKRPRAARATA